MAAENLGSGAFGKSNLAEYSSNTSLYYHRQKIRPNTTVNANP